MSVSLTASETHVLLTRACCSLMDTVCFKSVPILESYQVEVVKDYWYTLPAHI